MKLNVVLLLGMLIICFNFACSKDPNIPQPYNTVVDWEGNEYRTEVFGSQEWMIDNLMTNYYNNGDRISLPYITGQYSFHIITSNNICPLGWHVPLYWEWDILVEYYNKNHIPHDINGLGYWWTRSELHDGIESEQARAFYINSNTGILKEFVTLKDQLLSVRCVKD